MFPQSCLRSLVPLHEGRRRKMCLSRRRWPLLPGGWLMG